MGVPTRFAIEYPQRVSQLLDVLEPEARRRDLLGSFGLLAAMAVLTIPYERMQARHFLHRPDVDSDLSAAYKKLEKEGFKNAALWRGANPGNWREFRIAAETVNQPARWRDVHTGCHPFDPEAKDVIDDHEAEHVIRLLRNALSV